MSWRTLAGALLPREEIFCTRRAVLGAKSATVTMSLCAWKHSYDALFSCTQSTIAIIPCFIRAEARAAMNEWLASQGQSSGRQGSNTDRCSAEGGKRRPAQDELRCSLGRMFQRIACEPDLRNGFLILAASASGPHIDPSVVRAADEEGTIVGKGCANLGVAILVALVLGSQREACTHSPVSIRPYFPPSRCHNNTSAAERCIKDHTGAALHARDGAMDDEVCLSKSHCPFHARQHAMGRTQRAHRHTSGRGSRWR